MAIAGTASFLLSSCAPWPSKPFPTRVPILYYTQTLSLCPQGVLVKASLPETDRSATIGGIGFTHLETNPNGSITEVSTRVIEEERKPINPDVGAKFVAFRLTQSATVPSLTTALSQLPRNNRDGNWDKYYSLGYFLTDSGLNPTLSVQCQSDTPALTLTVPALQNGKLATDAVLVVEDPSVPAKLRLILQPTVE